MKQKAKATIMMMSIITMMLLCTTIASASPFTITSPVPVDGATGVNTNSSLVVNATITCLNGNLTMAHIYYYDSSGTYNQGATVGHLNDTITMTINASTSGHKYHWGVLATQGLIIVNQSYNFTTASTPVPSKTTTDYLIKTILPITIALAILVSIIGLAFTVGATKEGLITIMIISIIGIIFISIITTL